MRGIRMKFLPLTLIMVFYTAGIISGQELKEMEYQELDKSHIILDRADRSLLIIESTIPNIRFISNKGIIPGTYKEEPKGVWQAQVSPGVQLITIQADGYLPISGLRHNFQPSLALGLRITAKPQAVSAGKGSIKIETIPPGADIIFNNIPMRDKSPFTLYDQPAVKHLISLHKEGYAPVDTIISVPVDKTVSLSIALEKMYGGVRINSDPPGASVFLDGENIGRTPLSRNKIETGDYTLVLHLEGYIDVVQGLTVEYGETAETVAKLVKQMGAVIVTSNPAGADIYLNGEYKGISGTEGLKIEYLQVGKYTVKAEIDRYFPEEKDVNVYLNQTENVNLILKPKPGAVFVVSNPSGAEVYLDDIKRNGFTPVKIDSVEAGSHRIIFRLAGYRSEVKSVEVDAEKTTTVNCELVKGAEREIIGILSNNIKLIPGPLPGMEFVLIPGGNFQMGSNDGDNDEKPVHLVNIKSFQMMSMEVTQAQWQVVMGNNPSYFIGDDLPVESISWADCQEFIKKLNQLDPEKGYRLPTEAEWEYACRAGTTTNYHSGYNRINLNEVCWYNNNSGGKTHITGTKKLNNWGLFDMHGNVWEWCEDVYYKDYKESSKDGSAFKSYDANFHVVRGGSHENDPYFCRSSNRIRCEWNYSSNLIGLRLVRNP